MAASSASTTATKLRNLRNPALQTLLRRHLLHPSAAAASPAIRDARSPSVFLLDSIGTDSPDNVSSARNLNLYVTNNFTLNLQLPFGFPVMQIEAARPRVPDAHTDEDDNPEGSDDDFEDFDDEDLENYSGLEDFDDDDDEEEEDEDADEDEDPDIRRPSRK